MGGKKARRVCVFTGSRADYGPLLPVLRALRDDLDIDLRLLVSGGHLIRDQGLTAEQIDSDGFDIDERVEIVLASDTPTAIAKSLGLGVIGYADALDRINPDILVVLGDRYEALAVATVAAFGLLPIAHIAGGEVTHGSTDDSVRHAITKLAHLHFVANDEFAQRVLRMGEHPDRVIVTGSPGLDTVRAMPILDRAALESELRFWLRRPTFAVTYHPATADPMGSRAGIAGLLEALDEFPAATAVFTSTNIDLGGPRIGALIRGHVARRARRMALHTSLGQQRYLSLLKHSDVVVGNSSSGLIEAPALGTPTVNIGRRQDGRPRADSVIDCAEKSGDIAQAIWRALSSEHSRKAAEAKSPYGDGHASERILRALKHVPLNDLAMKAFHDPELRPCFTD